MKWTSQLSGVRIAILFILLILVISGLSVYWTFYRVVPSLGDTVTINGLRNEVTVSWDTHQVPHVQANHESDLYLAMGFLHARDRLWQMTRKQYKLEGLHSREIAESMASTDRFYLTMSFGTIAKEIYRRLPQPEKDLLDSYAKGVNAFIEKHQRHLPPEFALGDVQPIPWEPWHSIGVLMLWSWDQQQAFWAKPAMAKLQYIQDGTAIDALTGMDNSKELLWGSGHPSMEENAYQSLMDDFYRFTGPVSPPRSGLTGTGAAFARTGSNPYGFLSFTRESILTLPDAAYEMVLQLQGSWYYGITIPGLPVLTGGQNQDLAWMILPLISDNGHFFTGKLFHDPPPLPVDWENDPYIESRLNPDLTLDRHILPQRNGGELLVVTKRAGQRPVVAISEEHNRYLAFEWPAPIETDDIAVLLRISNSSDPEQLQRAAESLSISPVQILYVTSGGQTGRITGGRLITDSQPFRIKETDANNTPVSTVSAYAILPHQHHPTGNPVAFLEQTVPAYANATGKCLFAPPWNRSERILQLFEQTPRDQLSPDIIGQWLNDTYSSYAEELTTLIVAALEISATEDGTDALLELVIPYLRNWNYKFDPSETAATLFHLFQKSAARNLYRPWIADRDIEILFKTPNILYSAVSRLLIHPEKWPETHPNTHREWITYSMKETLGFLESNFGNEPYDWQWNRVVYGTFLPLLFEETRKSSRSARLAEKNLFQPEGMTVSGSPHSTKAMHSRHDRHAISITASATMKGIMMVQPEQSYYSVLSTGQSGNLFSGHFTDQFNLWNHGIMKQRSALPSDPVQNIQNYQRFIP